MICKCSFVKNL